MKSIVEYRSDNSPEHVAIVAVDNKCGIDFPPAPRQGKNKQINNMTWKTCLKKKDWASNFIKTKRKTQPAQSVILNFSFLLFTPTFCCFT